jgi:SAM-dependent methyltransferase
MSYDYDKLYGETPNALGEPTRGIVSFFDRLPLQKARVLDVGCGQGRDALFLARRGHAVTGVDLSPNGIRDLTAAARAEKLDVTGIVADVTQFTPSGLFDVVLIDRTLHMLPPDARLRVLTTLADHIAEHGWLVIADETRNIPQFVRFLEADHRGWEITYRKAGSLFACRR